MAAKLGLQVLQTFSGYDIIRWICGVTPDDDISSGKLHSMLGVEEVSSELRSLRWFGHVKRSSSRINSVMDMEIPGRRGRGRP